MKLAPLVLLLPLALAGCDRPVAGTPKSGERTLRTDEKIVRATLALLASDGKPVCVERQTFGSPLSIYRIARQGRLQNVYPLAWFPPLPFRPPVMPDLDQLREAAREGRDANMPEPAPRTDQLPGETQARLNAIAMALAPPAVPVHRVAIRSSWAPQGVVPRLLPMEDRKRGCAAQYVVSGVKWNETTAFAAVRVDHWGTVYALEKHGDDWRPVAQWGSWLY